MTLSIWAKYLKYPKVQVKSTDQPKVHRVFSAVAIEPGRLRVTRVPQWKSFLRGAEAGSDMSSAISSAMVPVKAIWRSWCKPSYVQHHGEVQPPSILTPFLRGHANWPGVTASNGDPNHEVTWEEPVLFNHKGARNEKTCSLSTGFPWKTIVVLG